MGRLLFGGLLLHILHSIYGVDNKPPTWPKYYEFSGRISSLTDGLEQRYESYVSDDYNKQLIKFAGHNEWEDVPVDDIYITRNGEYDTVERYYPAFSGTLKPLCGIYNTSKAFADSYRLPELSHPESKYRLISVKTFLVHRLEYWYQEQMVDDYVHIQESVWITYVITPQGRKDWILTSKLYKEFTVPTAVLSVYKTYYYEHVKLTKRPKDFFTPVNTQWPETFRDSFTNTTCANMEVPYVIDGSDSNKGENEIAMRQKLFKKRNLMMEIHNHGDFPFEVELNRFAYMTLEELKGYARCNDDSPTDLKELTNAVAGNPEQNIDLPESINWRLNGAVTLVKDQADCASCWAFAVVGAVESFHFINSKENELLVLSEQMLIDCVWNLNGTVKTGSRGCFGGKLEYGFQWITQFGGIQRSMEYGSYFGLHGLCSYNPINLIPLKKFQYVQTEKELKTALVQHGPVAVVIQADTKFMFYKAGIYESKDNDKFTNHAALLVGYGSFNGRDYWLIKNSWGRGWGEDGYMKLGHPKGSSGVIKYGFVPIK